jgi:hypothetical protein
MLEPTFNGKAVRWTVTNIGANSDGANNDGASRDAANSNVASNSGVASKRVVSSANSGDDTTMFFRLSHAPYPHLSRLRIPAREIGFDR